MSKYSWDNYWAEPYKSRTHASIEEIRDKYVEGQITHDEFEMLMHQAVMEKPVRPEPPKPKTKQDKLIKFGKIWMASACLPISFAASLFIIGHYMLRGTIVFSQVLGGALIAFGITLTVGIFISGIMVFGWWMDENA